MTEEERKRGATTLDSLERAAVMALIGRHGEPAAAVLLDVSRLAMVRAAAGLSLRRGTVLQIRVGLAAVGE